MEMTVSYHDIVRASGLLEGIVSKTPLVKSQTLSNICEAEVHLKLENLQYTASFKERGAYIKLASLTPEERAKGVIAVSAGNHAQGVAYNAKRLGIPATIVMPKNTPFTKVRHTRSHGAEVVLEGSVFAESLEAASKIQEERGLTFVHPFDDPHIIAGQGTVGLEILNDGADIDTIIVPIGGGGLAAGIVTAIKARRPDIEVIGVETKLYPSMYEGIKGLPLSGGGVTIAEGIAVKQPGGLTLEICKEKLDDVLLVEESSIERAIQMLIEIEKTVVEGAGAAPLAALLDHHDRFKGKKVCMIVSGGNIDTRLLAQVLMRGMAREGRLVRVRIEIPDVPGALATISALIGDAEANIIEVYHQRHFYDVPAKQTDVDMVLEVRDTSHAEQVITKLTGAGFGSRLLGNTSLD
ncbi:MAG TPA: threonine ammonia-lyase [Thalassospira sp.]|jgi:threonine dehydratase|nr:threonine ammonia-lyase [Thalassospira sp.]OHZ00747.1 threonine ammonia-lyase [Thalassospira sp. MIT1004]HBS21006.1 threonine ammonia-lyase [Thalassospira sp.]